MAHKREKLIPHYIYDKKYSERLTDPPRQMERAPETAVSTRRRKNREKARHMSIGYVTFLMVALGVACAFFLVNYIQNAVRTDCQDHGSIQNGERVELSEAGK